MNKDWKKYNGALITNLPPHEKNDMGKMKMLVKKVMYISQDGLQISTVKKKCHFGI